MRFDPLSFVIGKHGDSGPVRDVTSYLLGRATNGGIWQTIANVAVASFTSVSTTLRDLVIDVVPVQSGSGDPSPENVRPISGWTGANIVVSPTLDAQDGTTYPVSWQSEAGTVYGGTLTDNGDGTWTLTVMHGFKVFDGSEDWRLATDILYCNTVVADMRTPFSRPGYSRCNMFVVSNSGESKTIRFGVNSDKTVYIYGAVSMGFNTASAFKTFLSSNNLQIYYELATPVEYTLTAESVRILLGQNNIFADTGNINTITFRTH